MKDYLCEVNPTEFYYKTAEKLSIDVVDMRYEAVRNSPIIQVPVEGELARDGAKVKLKYRGKIPPADAYLIALTTDSRIKEILKDRCKLFEI
ncbi:MAG TPA: hypothetical protein ENG05_00325 [Acidilobales archaeon]|nr:hypothetical protein [Acidilobales archaeon]